MKCCFLIHKSCADAPITYQSKFHNEHILKLEYSLPEEYREYVSFCSICGKHINPIYWVYYCANCRFFAHVKCASLTEMLMSESNEEADSGESNLMHFPAQDETSLFKMMQQCIINATDAHNCASTAEPSPYIKHWGHKHQLALRNKNAKTWTLDSNQKLEDTELLICDGCTKPISMIDDIFYECGSCNFFLHRSCAQFPEKMEHHLAGKLDRVVLVREVNEQDITRCYVCNKIGNGIFLGNETASLDIGCASLPRKIKHEGHRHPLNQLKNLDDHFCEACMVESLTDKEAVMYGCEKCEFYIHVHCALKPHLVKHRWDSHPLNLIMLVKNVPDHPHEFECELCSKQIYPYCWFYHCNACDLSFHIACIDPYYWFSNIKLPATKYSSDAHPHGLTWVLNKKKRSCKICEEDVTGRPVLQCSPCRYVVHNYCLIFVALTKLLNGLT